MPLYPHLFSLPFLSSFQLSSLAYILHGPYRTAAEHTVCPRQYPVTPHVHTTLCCTNSRLCALPLLFPASCPFLIEWPLLLVLLNLGIKFLVWLWVWPISISPAALGESCFPKAHTYWGFNKYVCSGAHQNILPCLLYISALFIIWESHRTKKVVHW